MSQQRAAQLVEAGLCLQLAGDFAGAVKLWEEALRVDPGNARAKSLIDKSRSAALPAGSTEANWKATALTEPLPEAWRPLTPPPASSRGPNDSGPFRAPPPKRPGPKNPFARPDPDGAPPAHADSRSAAPDLASEAPTNPALGVPPAAPVGGTMVLFPPDAEALRGPNSFGPGGDAVRAPSFDPAFKRAATATPPDARLPALDSAPSPTGPNEFGPGRAPAALSHTMVQFPASAEPVRSPQGPKELGTERVSPRASLENLRRAAERFTGVRQRPAEPPSPPGLNEVGPSSAPVATLPQFPQPQGGPAPAPTPTLKAYPAGDAPIAHSVAVAQPIGPGHTVLQFPSAPAAAPGKGTPTPPQARNTSGPQRAPGATGASPWGQAALGSRDVDLGSALGGASDALSLVAVTPQPRRPDPAEQKRALIQGARDLLDLADHTGALELAEKLLEREPENPEARSIRERCQSVLLSMYESKIGRLDSRPKVAVRTDEIIWLNLDHRAGFLLAQVDGATTFEEIFSLSGMSRLETAKILVQLLNEKVIFAG